MASTIKKYFDFFVRGERFSRWVKRSVCQTACQVCKHLACSDD